MASTQAVQSAWDEYRASVMALLLPDRDERATDSIVRSRSFEERAEAYDQQSTRMEALLAEGLGADDHATRERYLLATLKVSAHDLEVANALLQPEQRMPLKALALDAVPERDDDLFAFPPGDRIGSELDSGTKAMLGGHPATRKQLQDAIDAMLKSVPQSVAKQGLGIIGSVASDAVWGAITKAAPQAVQEILTHLPKNLRDKVGAAITALGHYIAKAVALFGQKTIDAVVKWATKQLDDLRKDAERIGGWIGNLYDTDRLGTELHLLLTRAEATAEQKQFAQALQNVKDLNARYEGQATWLDRILTAVGLAQTLLLAQVPWGPIIVGCIFGLSLAYAVCIGGDYLDWHRVEAIGWLDAVDGLRTVVAQELSVG